ncbi:uncharacterized protein AKAW2_31377S [Aspergillus luchuensis]|uniref:Uncharacterized protein n=3 Tax=Aspergillus subgen. Circumdati TaxID=2720871 RepID=A0A7R8A8N1_ASPKA|nr:uncharacterized protein AKAW2_31377S [Aspergillus luchuensis]BCR98058.1 hypothetical protein AKAW2_31377S [Aspergillus luchuensis]BCS10509.1 hypothetical protein ALUC_31326S [Aspergillus luchuensis]
MLRNTKLLSTRSHPFIPITTRAGQLCHPSVSSYQHRCLVTSQTIHKERHLESDLDRHLLRPEHNENTKSGTDDEAAHHWSSYDPTITDPDLEVLACEEECELDGELDDPLFVSPGNREVSRFLDPMIGGAVHGATRPGPSGRGWTRKHKEVIIKKIPGSQFEKYDRILQELRKADKRATK